MIAHSWQQLAIKALTTAVLLLALAFYTQQTAGADGSLFSDEVTLVFLALAASGLIVLGVFFLQLLVIAPYQLWRAERRRFDLYKQEEAIRADSVRGEAESLIAQMRSEHAGFQKYYEQPLLLHKAQRVTNEANELERYVDLAMRTHGENQMLFKMNYTQERQATHAQYILPKITPYSPVPNLRLIGPVPAPPDIVKHEPILRHNPGGSGSGVVYLPGANEEFVLKMEAEFKKGDRWMAEMRAMIVKARAWAEDLNGMIDSGMARNA
ncbi:hypothetical protein [Brevundimonas basaltis]|uniref:Uncharacterized protein n=1 Tax=Brevundimonas basaltis TaxID=472166 RepID=A0A7W8HXJ7_9CAUL|nr:hypothetical protein [Brevundimonas basaltis]